MYGVCIYNRTSTIDGWCTHDTKLLVPNALKSENIVPGEDVDRQNYTGYTCVHRGMNNDWRGRKSIIDFDGLGQVLLSI